MGAASTSPGKSGQQHGAPPFLPQSPASAQHTLSHATPSVPQLACSLHTAFLKSSFRNVAFQEVQQGASK